MVILGLFHPFPPLEASLHSFRTLHWSGPNLTALRRVGLAVRYVRADVQRSRRLRRRESAMLACGQYDAAEGAFDAAWAGIVYEIVKFDELGKIWKNLV